jgi:hypothetical protein
VSRTGRPKIDISGQHFGRWTAIASIGDGWLCRCDCGTEKVVSSSHLRNGRTKSCGCATSELLSQPRTHGKRHTRAWKIWSGIIQRCNNPRHARYADYGGRGIAVCDSWKTFEGFYADMGDPPEGCSIDRIDNELGYCKSNCRWSSKIEQARNTRTNRIFEINGVSKSLAEWCEIYGVIYTTAHSRVSRGWSIERALGVTA